MQFLKNTGEFIWSFDFVFFSQNIHFKTHDTYLILLQMIQIKKNLWNNNQHRQRDIWVDYPIIGIQNVNTNLHHLNICISVIGYDIIYASADIQDLMLRQYIVKKKSKSTFHMFSYNQKYFLI